MKLYKVVRKQKEKNLLYSALTGSSNPYLKQHQENQRNIYQMID